jgi:hypothetical protein
MPSLARETRFSHPSICAHHLSAGTTIGYGDMTPATDLGKIAVAIYAIVAVNAVVALLLPARQYLEGFCRVKDVVKYSDAKLA